MNELAQKVIDEFKVSWLSDQEFIGCDYLVCPFCKVELTINGEMTDPVIYHFGYANVSFNDIIGNIGFSCKNCYCYNYFTIYSKKLGSYSTRYSRKECFSYDDYKITIDYIAKSCSLTKGGECIANLKILFNIDVSDMEKTINKIKTYAIIG